MINQLTEAKQILEKYHQEHLLYFYQDLTSEEKEKLLHQILTINFHKVIKLYEDSLQNKPFDINTISPLPHFEKKQFSKEEIQHYTKIGEDLIRSGFFAVVTMAGGQGTRLGYHGPKGTYELKFDSDLFEKPVKKSLFQIMCEDIKRNNQKYQVTIPWYIMTSKENDKKTKAYFEAHDFFGYPKEKIKFFTQGNLPLVDTHGKFILQEMYLIKEASNGNGNVFRAMKKHKIIDDLEKNQIKWIFFGGIDNVLLKNVDLFFLGLAITKNYEIASKSIFKKDPLENTSVFCKEEGKPSILYYDNITKELSDAKFSNGMYQYREANILSHLISLEAVKRISEVQLRYHRAFKKNTFVNEEGMKQVPEKPNTYKFENFIFDAFSLFDDMLLLRVNEEEEFAPIKDFTGIYNPDTAKEKYENYWRNHKEEF